MDNGLLPEADYTISLSSLVLILIVMDNGLLRTPTGELVLLSVEVLILIVMDNGLLLNSQYLSHRSRYSLNPYCNG